ncbi:hypothetical protein CVT26_015984 [Gymnopilus dilepis]|uniref:F-box domain-containing protein n=1 Tax=Gymnopilus dilepis TaxID=231916 RepID=A0A409WXH3_9AGAR|nr:hypothetical protein CVT26_015984 [Gymnopilus dilepis]
MPLLVQAVRLSRSPPQIFDFCAYVLKHNLCDFVVRLTITKSAFHSESERNLFTAFRPPFDPDRSASFANALIPVLGKAKNLAHLAFDECIDLLLKCGPAVAEAICQRPPSISLELWGAEGHTLKRFESISGLTHVRLQTFPVHKYFGEAEEAAEAILKNSCKTLKTVSVGHAVPLSLRLDGPPAFSCSGVRHFSMHGSSVQIERVALMFPNLQSLECVRSLAFVIYKDSKYAIEAPPLLFYDCPPRNLWPLLRSFSGPKPLALNLSRNHSLRRLNFINHYAYSEASQFDELSETLANSDIRSISFDLDLWPASTPRLSEEDDAIREGYPTLLDSCFSSLSAFAKNLAYLSIQLAKSPNEIPASLKHLIRTAPMLASMQHLKYVELGVMTWFGPTPFYAFATYEVHTKPEEIVRAWAQAVPSLEYLELYVVFEGWEHTWWRIDANDRTFWSISREEGLDVKHRYDMEAWREE